MAMVLRHYQQVANAGFTHAAPPPLIFDTTACDFGLGRVRVGFASDATAYSEPHPTRSDSLCPARWITFPVYKATTRGGCCDASGPLPNRTAGFITLLVTLDPRDHRWGARESEIPPPSSPRGHTADGRLVPQYPGASSCATSSPPSTDPCGLGPAARPGAEQRPECGGEI